MVENLTPAFVDCWAGMPNLRASFVLAMTGYFVILNLFQDLITRGLPPLPYPLPTGEGKTSFLITLFPYLISQANRLHEAAVAVG